MIECGYRLKGKGVVMKNTFLKHQKSMYTQQRIDSSDLRIVDEFLKLFNSIEDYVNRYAFEGRKGYSNGIFYGRKQNKIIAEYFEFLKAIGTIRNMIIHDSESVSNPIVLPSEDTMEILRKVHGKLMHPIRLIDIKKGAVYVLNDTDTLSKALELIRTKNLSKIPLRTKEGIICGVLTENGITRYIASTLGDIDLDLPLSSVMNYEDNKERHIELHSDATIDDAIDCFGISEKGGRIKVILVMDNPLSLRSIITASDILPYSK